MRPTFHKILVPVDFSPCSQEAYRAAVTLAEQFKAELIILHVIDTRILEGIREAGLRRDDVAAKALQRASRLRLRSFLAGHSAHLKIRRLVVTGVPFHEIVKLSRLEKVDLIVMGRYGGTGDLEKIFFGSTAEKVVRIAPCAVLSIPLTGEARRGPKSDRTGR